MVKMSNSISEKYGNEGDKLFEQEQYIEAYEKYSLSLGYAETTTFQALAHERRSLASLKLGMYSNFMLDNKMAMSGISALADPSLKFWYQKLYDCGEQCLKILQTESIVENFKNDQASEVLRNQANKLFDKKKYQEALVLYNESICYAKSDLNLALGYANRSAVFLELNFLPQSMKNIKLAREHGYPDEKMDKLDKRELKCVEKMTESSKNDADSGNEFYKLSYKANPKIPFIIDGLELRQNEKNGRYIITNRDLKPGDIICMETPFLAKVNSNPFDETKPSNPHNRFMFCAFCLEGNRMDLIPCKTCNVTMYCSHDCLEQAQRYHTPDCSFTAICHNLQESVYIDHSLTSAALTIMNGSYEELEKLNNECLVSPKTIFDFDFSDPKDPEFFKNQLRVGLSMAKLKIKSSPDFSLILKNLKVPESAHKFMKKFLLQTAELANGSSTETNDGHFKISFFAGLLNHSCNPNVKLIPAPGKNRVIAIRHISKGEQVFDAYCHPFYVTPKAARAEQLRLRANFICECEACRDPAKFPLFPELKTYDQALLNFAIKFQPEFIDLKLTKAEITKSLHKVINKMQKHHGARRFPSKEYMLLSVGLNNLLVMIEEKLRVEGKFCK